MLYSPRKHKIMFWLPKIWKEVAVENAANAMVLNHYKLKQLRLERKWTIRETAEKIGVSHQAYLKYEQGTVKSTNNIQQIANVFNVDVSVLLIDEKDLAATAPHKPHLYVYKVTMRDLPNGWVCAESKDFDLGCNAATSQEALSLLNGEIIKEAIKMVRYGKPFPEPTKTIEKNGIYLTVDFHNLFRETFPQENTRRNITLPAWMDYKLRLYGIDASPLFQEAANNAILEYELFNRLENTAD